MFRYISYILLLLFAGLTLTPLFWIISTALQAPSVVLAFPPNLIPSPASLINFIHLFNGSQILTWMSNSLIVTLTVTLSNVLLGTLAGYTLAKKRFPGRQAIFWMVISLMFIPTQLTIIPLYALIVKLDWINTYMALIVPILIMPFSIFLMKQFLQTLPTELIESARLDGCGEW